MPAESSSDPKLPSKNVLRNLIAIAAVGVIIIIALVTARLTVYVPYRIPSGSMRPTLDVAQIVAANGLDKDAVRGAVMVFEFPERPSNLFVKRVVGVSGDKIAVNKGRITINGWDVPHCDVGKFAYTDDGETRSGTLEVEYLGDSTYLVFHSDDAIDGAEGPWVVKSGEYFVMGDNRDNAHDSRKWFGGAGGGVPFANTKGRLRLDDRRPRLPKGADANRAAFEACLKNKPAVTSPPIAK